MGVCAEIALCDAVRVDDRDNIKHAVLEQAFTKLTRAEETFDKAIHDMAGGSLARMHTGADEDAFAFGEDEDLAVADLLCLEV